MSRGLFLLHFEPRYHHAGHYLGYAKRDLDGYSRRVAAGLDFPHELVRDAVLYGMVELTIARTWPGWSRDDRCDLRAAHGLSRHCPICRDAGTWHR
jgi:hypothetical protein